jgi:cell division protein FtsB
MVRMLLWTPTNWYLILLMLGPPWSPTPTPQNDKLTQILESIKALSRKVDIQNTVIGQLKDDNTALKARVRILEDDNAALKCDNTALKCDNTALKARVGILEEDNQVLQEAVDGVCTFR